MEPNGAQVAVPLAPPLALDGQESSKATLDPMSPSREPKENEEATLGVLSEKMDTLRKEVDALKEEVYALQRGATLQEKVKDLQGKWRVLETVQEKEDALQDGAAQEGAEDLRGKRGGLANLDPEGMEAILDFLQEKADAVQKELNALRKGLDALQGGATGEKTKDLQGKQGVLATLDPPMSPSEEEEEEEVTLDVLRENVGVLQKEVDALQVGGATQEKVKALQKEWKIQKAELDGFILEKICALEDEVEALWDAWFQDALRKIFLKDQGLSQENVNSLQYYLLIFLENMSVVKKVDELLQEEHFVPCHRLGYALWEMVEELDFALRYIHLYTIDELQEMVDACGDALRKGAQEEVGALQEKLEAMQNVLRAVPLKELSALLKITALLHDTLLDFPSDSPTQEKQDALWNALRDVPLKEMCDLWRKVRALWGFPPKIFAVWEKVYSLKTFRWAESRNRVWILQEEVEALKDDLREALREEMGAHQDKLTALWTAVQDSSLNELYALDNKLNALEERLWNVPEEKLSPLKETVHASQKVLDSLHRVSQGELSEEVDALQRSPVEEKITETDKSDFLPDTGPGLLSVTQQADLSKMKQMIHLNMDQEISLTSSQPDDLGRSKGQNTQVTEELICEDILEAPLASSEQTAPELASSEPLHKKPKMDALHSSQGPTSDQEMVKEYK